MVGFCIVLLASIFFCFQNVIVKVLFSEHSLLGIAHLGGFVTPTLQHSFLLMFMRMLLVVPLMATLAAKLYPLTWKELYRLRDVERHPLLLQSLGAGVLMFLYLALLYFSIGMIPTGIAIALFFTYPVFTALLAWRFFGDRPPLRRWLIMGVVFLGSILTIPEASFSAHSASLAGVLTGFASGIAYALYTIVAQKTFAGLHPVPFTWISFATTLVLSGASLVFWQIHEAPLPWWPLWVGGGLSAIVTFAGHLLNNWGIRLIGAPSASMIGASNPALTALLAWFSIQETLNLVQVSGIVIATLGVLMLSRDRQFRQPHKT